MSSLINYIYDCWYDKQQTTVTSGYHMTDEFDYSIVDAKYLISKEDLEKINLKPVDNIIPGPSRNMPPLDKVNLQSLNKAQLNVILNVKLKPIPQIEKQTKYLPRHPVLRELLDKYQAQY